MPVEGVYSVEEKRALVYEYVRAPHGSKSRFLADREISVWQLRRWRKMVFADTLEVGLVPRGGQVTAEDSGAVKRLLAENEALRAQLAAREEELAVQQRAVDVLGKAIETLHRNDATKDSSNVLVVPASPSSPSRKR